MGEIIGYTRKNGEDPVHLQRVDINYPHLNIPVLTREATSILFWIIRHLEDKDIVELIAKNPIMTSIQLIRPGEDATSRILSTEITVSHIEEKL